MEAWGRWADGTEAKRGVACLERLGSPSRTGPSPKPAQIPRGSDSRGARKGPLQAGGAWTGDRGWEGLLVPGVILHMPQSHPEGRSKTDPSQLWQQGGGEVGLPAPAPPGGGLRTEAAQGAAL